MLRYHGVLAAHSSPRAEVVLGRESPSPPAQLPLFVPADVAPPAPPEPPSRHPWAWLLRRVFAVDVTTCPVDGCAGRMRLVQLATKPRDIARVLATDGPLRARDPPRRRDHQGPPPRGQLLLSFGGAPSAAVHRSVVTDRSPPERGPATLSPTPSQGFSGARRASATHGTASVVSPAAPGYRFHQFG